MRLLHKILAMLMIATFFISNAVADDTASNNDVRIYIIHGYNATPKRHWFNWLRSELSSAGGVIKAQNIFIPQLPDAKHTSLESWTAALKEAVGNVDSNTYFITHSLGGIALLNYINDNGFKVGGVVLVSAFDKALPNLPQLDSFMSEKLDYNKLISLIKHRVVISARDDKIVPYKMSEELSDELDAKFILEQNGGHFLDTEGYTSLRVGYDALKQMIDEDTAQKNNAKKAETTKK